VSLEPRLSFGRAVDAYERARPQYADDAVAHLASRFPMHRVLDLGAGTGKLTRQLVPVAESVVAVEPDDDMRAMLERVLPDVESHAGSAEAIPLPNGSVDVVTAAQAFHWFDVEAALAEMHRVLRPDGGIALLSNQYDWPELNAILDRLRTAAKVDDDSYERLLATPLFVRFEKQTFAHADRVDADAVVERISSISSVIAAAPADRTKAFDDIRALVSDGTVDFPMLTTVIAADRA
jgi:ubiquinone/menaquinone biosynthesis C-methylase UbiE